MRTYSFTGISEHTFRIESQFFYVKTFETGLGFKAEVKATSFRKAIVILHNAISDYDYSLDSLYCVVNESGKSSFRFMKEYCHENQT